MSKTRQRIRDSRYFCRAARAFAFAQYGLAGGTMQGDRTSTLSRLRQYVLNEVSLRKVGPAPSRDQLLDVLIPYWQSQRPDQRRKLALALQDLGFREGLLENMVAYAESLARNKH